MGEIFKPEDIFRRRFGSVEFLHDIKEPLPGFDLQALAEEVRKLKMEVEKIKRVLRQHGIDIE